MTSDEQQYWKRWSIYTVPAYVADLNRKAYPPQVVSFGPYHHGEDHLRPMENHKSRVRVKYLGRSAEPYEPFLESLKKGEGDLKASYDTLNPKWTKGSGDSLPDWKGSPAHIPSSDQNPFPSLGSPYEFLDLMITDGCFMLEILMYTAGKVKDYEDNDPIFSKHGKLYVIPLIRRDMLLLENQLPMPVLNLLFDFCYSEKEDESVIGLILKFYSASLDNVSKDECLHVLDVFRKSMLMDSKKRKAKSEEIIRPATELHEHGICFKKSGTNSVENISFSGGVLKLPEIVVDEHTESMFLNLIAFERSHVGAGNEVTSYIFFMDNIIDKGQDVALLHTKGIINNAMESDEAAAKLFNSLATGVVLDPDSSLHDVINKVRDYCKKRRHKWRASFIHTYFRNPWVTLSLIAAVLLFGLTIFQAVYTALSYYK